MLGVPPFRAPRSCLIAATALIALLAGCTSSISGHSSQVPAGSTSDPSTQGPARAPAPPTTLAFSDCSGLFNLSAAGIPPNRLRKLHFDCAQLPVPLDYANPNGATLRIEVMRVHYDDQPHRVGSLLVNPGGPGASGVILAINLAAVLDEDVLQHFDIIGFDPRGVGLSAPIKCYTDTQETQALAFEADVRTTAGLQAAKGQAAAFAQSCTAKYGSSLAYYNTVNAARDMDRIRAGVGDDKLSYLGFSYGTELGAVYAHLFPKRIRAAVLDGAVDPVTTGNAIASNEQQLAGFEGAFDQFAADCRTREPCNSLGDPRQAVTALVKRADSDPIPSSDDSDNRRATGGNVMYAVLSALYSAQLWPELGNALIAAQHGDARGLFALDDRYSERSNDGHYSNLLDVFQVVMCNDQKSDPTDAQITATATRWVTQYPLFGLWTATALFQCQAWPDKRTPVPPETAVGSAPIVVVGNLHDPATPYAGAVHLASTLRTGVLLTWNGQGHTSYGQSSCIDDKVNAYLINGTVPTAHTTCGR